MSCPGGFNPATGFSFEPMSLHHWREGLTLSILFCRLSAETPAEGWHTVAHTPLREQAFM